MKDFDFEKEFANAHFILVGHGDGRGTSHVAGYQALVQRVEADCGERLDHGMWQDEWAWSDETPSKPYHLHMPFEAEGLTIIRLSDETVVSLAAAVKP